MFIYIKIQYTKRDIFKKLKAFLKIKCLIKSTLLNLTITLRVNILFNVSKVSLNNGISP